MSGERSVRASRRTLVTGGSGFIGTNLTDRLLATGREVLGLCGSAPRRAEHVSRMRVVDVRDATRLSELVRQFEPTEVVHLAARTDFLEREDPVGWEVNTCGTRNVVAAVAASGRSTRCVFASSYVVAQNAVPMATPSQRRRYAESKLEAERIVRDKARFDGAWCIVRPCAVWGPWFDAPFRQFFLAIARGRYMHPGWTNPPKLMGFVDNVTYQIQRLLEAPPEDVHERTFYLADYEATTIRRWATMIADRLGVRRPWTLPGPAVRLAAVCGDLLAALGHPGPPVTTTRLANLRRDTSRVPVDPIREIAGALPCSLEQGVERTVNWMREAGLIDARRES